jgi:hypothetical protein
MVRVWPRPPADGALEGEKLSSPIQEAMRGRDPRANRGQSQSLPSLPPADGSPKVLNRYNGDLEVEASGYHFGVKQQWRRLKGLVLSCARLHALQAI